MVVGSGGLGIVARIRRFISPAIDSIRHDYRWRVLSRLGGVAMACFSAGAGSSKADEFADSQASASHGF
jgi:hypothetical protein